MTTSIEIIDIQMKGRLSPLYWESPQIRNLYEAIEEYLYNQCLDCRERLLTENNLKTEHKGRMRVKLLTNCLFQRCLNRIQF